jgi:hypothetical protein
MRARLAVGLCVVLLALASVATATPVETRRTVVQDDPAAVVMAAAGQVFAGSHISGPGLTRSPLFVLSVADRGSQALRDDLGLLGDRYIRRDAARVLGWRLPSAGPSSVPILLCMPPETVHWILGLPFCW